MLRGYTIPLLDLSNDTFRQSVVDREEGQYLGHPTTVLLDDDRTVICVYPGHAAGEEERAKLTELLASLPPQVYNILHQRFLNAGEGAPECFVVQRQRDPKPAQEI